MPFTELHGASVDYDQGGAGHDLLLLHSLLTDMSVFDGLLPTLVICGELDLTTPPELARALAQGIPGAQYREIADCGHCPMVEQPAALIACIITFLSGAA